MKPKGKVFCVSWLCPISKARQMQRSSHYGPVGVGHQVAGESHLEFRDTRCWLFATALPLVGQSVLSCSGRAPRLQLLLFQPWWGVLCSFQCHCSAGCSFFLNLSFTPRSQLVPVLMEASLASCPDAYCSLCPDLTWLKRVLCPLEPSLVFSLFFCFVFCMCSFVKHTRGAASRSSSVSSVNSP